MNRYIKVFFGLGIVFVGVYYRIQLERFVNNLSKSLGQQKKVKSNVFNSDELAQYNGISNPKLYVAVLGTIFDVTQGGKHYAKDASYHYFVGKDGSRALVTGNFNDESKNKDQILDLSCNELIVLSNWKDSFKDKYPLVGILNGRYFNENGQETAYAVEFKNKLKQCQVEKEMAKKKDLQYPPCNIAWNEDEGTKVWCTNTSGGVTRSWAGVPRQLYTPGEDNPRCVCVDEKNVDATALLKEYENCHITSKSCMFTSS